MSVFCEALINIDILRHQVSKRLLLGRFSAHVDFLGFLEALVRHFAHAAAPERGIGKMF